MTYEEENALFTEYARTHDPALRNKIVEKFFYVAEILAKKFAGRGVEYDDLLQVASEALISGVEKFAPELGNRFTTYVTPTITGAIKNYFRDFSRTVRIPRRIYAVSAKVKDATNEYYRDYGVKPTVKQLASLTGFSEELVVEAIEFRPPVSLDAPVKTGDDGNETSLSDVLSSDKDRFAEFDDVESLKTEIDKLDPTEKQVITLRYIEGKSQAEVGKLLGVSQMFVSRAERRIVEKLKEALSDD